MKVALIVPGGFGEDGHRNIIPALVALVGELAARHEVHVFTFVERGEAGEHALAGARIHRVEYPSSAAAPAAAAAAARAHRRGLAAGRLGAQILARMIRVAGSGRFDCVHAFWANEPGVLAGLLGRALRAPVVVSVGGGEAVWMPEIGYGGAGSRLGRGLTGLAFRLADVVTVGTEYARSFLPEEVARRARVIPLGISCRQFAATPDRPKGPPWRLLHVANLNLVKDQNTLLIAFAEVRARLGDVSLDCVGADALAGAVQARARGLGLGDHVRFHGLLSPAELVPFFRQAHLQVLSSRYESQGVVVLEAAAAGLPTVGTAVGLLPTLSPRAARSVPPGDAAALAATISELLRDEDQRRATGAAAQEFARAHDVSSTAQAFEEIYRALARPPRPRRRAT